MKVPEDRRYTKDHEWALLEEGRVRIGITDYAQDALGDVVFVQLPEVGAEVEADNGSKQRVSKIAPSPLPNDPRPCVYLQST